jgi:hypothetical protein
MLNTKRPFRMINSKITIQNRCVNKGKKFVGY